MYLRTKSYRKALTWQKKYLTTVIQGYKVLLNLSGAGFEHPDILQREVLMNPSSVGLVNRRSPITRFRIYVKVVLAIGRMRFMVRRWTIKAMSQGSPDRPHYAVYAGTDPAASPRTALRLKYKSRNRARGGDQLSPALSLASLSGFEAKDCETVLSQYMRRIQVLEKEVGQVLGGPPPEPVP